MTAPTARALGINHVALEVGDIAEALAFYGSLVEFEVHRQSESAAFVYFGDQFINFSKGRSQAQDASRHFGLVVDDKEAVRERLAEIDVEVLPGRFLDFLDPWGNRVEIVSYQNVRFTKAPEVLAGMGIEDPGKNDQARAELEKAGMARDPSQPA